MSQQTPNEAMDSFSYLPPYFSERRMRDVVYHRVMETDFDEVRPLVGSVDATTSKSKFKVAPGTEEIRFYSVETLTRNFYGLALAFSVSNACATSCLDYATALLGNRLGGFSSGALFATYAATSFFLSKSIVTTIGPKNGLTCGVIGYSAYVCGFLVSAMLVNLLPSLASFILLLTSIIGGIAGGVLWTSQGLYFTRHAALYAQSTAQEIDRITGDFSAIFAVILLGMEMAVKLVGSIMFTLLGSYGIVALAFLYITGVLFSCFVIMRIKTLDMRGTWDTSYQTVSKDTGAVARLVYTDSRLGLLLPFQMAFGLASSFVPYYIFGTIVSGSPSMGISAVGLLSAMVVLTGAVSAIPISFFANAFGKPKAIILGAICLILTGLPMWIFNPMTLGSWAIIVPLLVIYGVGRAVWETINKAVFVDFFAEDYDKNASAFSAATFANGYASGMAYITYSYMSTAQMTSVLVFACAVGLFAYLQAFSAQDKYRQRMRAEAEAETHLDAIRMEGRKSRRDRDRKMTLDRLAAQSLNLSPEKSPGRGRGRGGSGSEEGRGSRDSGRVSPSLSFSMGSGGISLITGSRGGSHEDLIDAFKSVATRKIGGGVGGALGNFSASVGVRPRESKSSKSSKSRSNSKSNNKNKSVEGGKSYMNDDGSAAGGAGNPDAGSADGGDDGMISAIDEGEDEETGLSRSGDSQDSSLSGERRGISSGAL